MAFINEYISEEDFKKYDIKGICEQFDISFYRLAWTVDREKAIFLIFLADKSCADGYFGSKLLFYWKGSPIRVDLMKAGAGGSYKEKSFCRWALQKIELPEALEEQMAIMAELKNALTAYKAGGIEVPVADHTVYFDF